MVAKFWLDPVVLERTERFTRSELNTIARLVQKHHKTLWRDGMNSSAIELHEGRARHVTVGEEALTVDLVDGRTIIVPLVWYPRLWHGTPGERNHFKIFGDGAYIHWPDLDEDLTVAGLLAGRRSGENPESLKKWMESRKGQEK